MRISHLIFTRFNIQYEPEDTIGIQPEWLDERLRLFEQFCLPSIQAQTCQDFIWILLGDVRTPEAYKARIEKYALHLPQIRTYWVGYQNDGYHTVYKQIGQDFAQGKDILISTRLDSDDALPTYYIEKVQKIAKDGSEGIIAFPLGKQTFARENKSFIVRCLQNHFLSRIEHSGFETIMVYDHSLLDNSQLLIFETDKPMWEEVVHGGNLHNDFEPRYHYYPRNCSEAIDIAKRWIHFQAKRLVRGMKALFVCSNKA